MYIKRDQPSKQIRGSCVNKRSWWVQQHGGRGRNGRQQLTGWHTLVIHDVIFAFRLINLPCQHNTRNFPPTQAAQTRAARSATMPRMSLVNCWIHVKAAPSSLFFAMGGGTTTASWSSSCKAARNRPTSSPKRSLSAQSAACSKKTSQKTKNKQTKKKNKKKPVLATKTDKN